MAETDRNNASEELETALARLEVESESDQAAAAYGHAAELARSERGSSGFNRLELLIEQLTERVRVLEEAGGPA